MNPENTMLKESSQKRSHTEWIHLYEVSTISKSKQTESKLVVISGCGIRRWEWGVTANDRVSFWTVENVLKLIKAIVVQLYEYTKTHWIVHFKTGKLYGMWIISQ